MRAPAFALLLQAVRPQADVEDIRRLAAEVTDWDALATHSRKHAVVPLLMRGLNMAGLSVPQALKAYSEAAVRQSLALTRDLLKAVGALNDAGIPYLTFKGPTESVLAYGSPGLRSFDDIDLIVDAADLDSARAALQPLGYEISNVGASLHGAPPTQILLHRQGTRSMIDLHSRWTQFPRLYDLPFAQAYQRRRTIDIAGTPVQTLADEERFLFLCLHGGLHFWGKLNWICDLAWECSSAGHDMAALSRRAAEIGLSRSLKLGMALAHDLFATRMPQDVGAASLPPGLGYLKAEITRLLEEHPGQPRRGRAHALLCHLLLRDDNDRRLAELQYRWQMNFGRPQGNR